MKRLSKSLLQAVVLSFLFYVMIAGGTYLGILQPQTRILSVAFLAVTFAAWLFVRYRQGWTWHRSPLDAAVGCFVLAFAVSVAFNADVWRYTAIGLWFVGLYIAFWYLCWDLFANHSLTHGTLISSLLMGGAFVIAIGYFQLRDWFALDLPAILSGAAPFAVPRPSSTYGNPNFLATILVLAIPLAIGQWFNRRLLGRVLLAVYVLLAIPLLLLTFSRGGWIALGAALALQAALMLAGRNLLHPRRFMNWWRGWSPLYKAASIAGTIVAAAAVLGVGVILIRSLSLGGRTIGLRTYIYEDALKILLEKPLAGEGLYAFSRGFIRHESMPPTQIHLHAHNIILHIGAELGIVGLAALVVAVFLIVRAMAANWRSADIRKQNALTGAIAAAVGFGIHQLLDVTAMLPAVTIAGMAALAAALFPVAHDKAALPHQRRGFGAVGVVLPVVLVIVGAWSTQRYVDYVDVLNNVSNTNDYEEAAQALDNVIANDPAHPFYYYQQGMLYALAAAENESALPAAIQAYEAFVSLEPIYAPAWANLGGLYWQAGQTDAAVEAMQEAARLAPRSWQIALNLGSYYEAAGDETQAQAAYERALELAPETALLPLWQETALRRDVSADIEISELGAIGRLLKAGEAEQARELWDSRTPRSSDSRLAVYTLETLLALENGDRDAAVESIDRLAAIATPAESAWLDLANAALAEYDGDSQLAAQLTESARVSVIPDGFDRDYTYGEYQQLQFMHLSLLRQFVPQVCYPTQPPLLLHLLGSPDAPLCPSPVAGGLPSEVFR